MTRKPRKSRAAKRASKPRSAAKKARGKVRSAPKSAAKKVVKAARTGKGGKPVVTAKVDSLDTFIVAAASALALPIDPAWMPAIKTNLDITLRHAALVAEFKLPDEAEPAPIFKA